MKQITLNIPDNKYNFFLELINNLGFNVKDKKTINLNLEEKEFVKNIEDAFKDVELHLQGKKKLQNASDFLNEL
ncbi:MAG: hypothetical protein H8D45_05815 [Bacteroidetes bacterium]|nr:hypothetical protein [Bacteroidota bacterium]